jgi:deoxycytidylate deaminase
MSKEQNITAILKDKRGYVLSIGKNSYTKTHPIQAKHAQKVGLPEKIYLHAEVDALVRCKDLSKVDNITVIRETRHGRYLNAKPCPVCMSALKAAGIKNIFHT